LPLFGHAERVAFVVAVLLAIFVLDEPWDWLAVAGGGAIELGEAWFWWRWSHRRRAAVGAEALVGRVGQVDADGWLRVNGERWRVRDAGPGDRVRVVAVDGLTLVAERLPG
jgi:membrane protein implicated in regulation of membrane protease activity